MRPRAIRLLLLVTLVPLFVIALPSRPDGPDGRSEEGGGESEALRDDEALALLGEANAKLEGHEHFGAIRRFERLLQAGRYVPEAHLGLAQSYLDLGDLDAARDACASAVETSSPEAGAQSETHARATELAREIELERSYTVEVAVPDLAAAIEAGGGRSVALASDAKQRIAITDADGATTSFDLGDLSPLASLRATGEDGGAPFVVTLASPYGDRITHTAGSVESSRDRLELSFDTREDAERAVEATARAVRALTHERPATFEEEVQDVVATLDELSLCVSGEFLLEGGSHKRSSYSVATFHVRFEAPRTLQIERENEDVVDVAGAGGTTRVAWTIDLARIDFVRVERVQKREFGSWLVRGGLGDVTFGDLLDELDVVEIGPVASFERVPAASERADTRLLLPVGNGDARELARSLFAAAQLARD